MKRGMVMVIVMVMEVCFDLKAEEFERRDLKIDMNECYEWLVMHNTSGAEAHWALAQLLHLRLSSARETNAPFG